MFPRRRGLSVLDSVVLLVCACFLLLELLVCIFSVVFYSPTSIWPLLYY